MDAHRDTTSQDLSAWLDGELSGPEARRVVQAVEADPALRAEADALAAVRRAVRELPRQKAPDDFVARVLAEAERTRLFQPRQAEQKPGLFGWVRYAAAAAVLLVAVGAGFVIFQTLRHPPRFGETLAVRSAPRAGAPEAGALPAKDTHHGVPDAEARDAKSYVVSNGGLAVAHRAKEFGAGEASQAGGAWDIAAKGARQGGEGGAPGGTVLAAAPPDAGNEVIFTDHLEATQQQVETLLAANGIRPVVLAGAAGAKLGKGGRPVSRANFYKAERVAPQTVEIDLVVTPEQLASVQRELDALRDRQIVSQEPCPPGEPARRTRGGREVPLPAASPPPAPAPAAPPPPAEGKLGPPAAESDTAGKQVEETADKRKAPAETELPQPRKDDLAGCVPRAGRPEPTAPKAPAPAPAPTAPAVAMELAAKPAAPPAGAAAGTAARNPATREEAAPAGPAGGAGGGGAIAKGQGATAAAPSAPATRPSAVAAQTTAADEANAPVAVAAVVQPGQAKSLLSRQELEKLRDEAARNLQTAGQSAAASQSAALAGARLQRLRITLNFREPIHAEAMEELPHREAELHKLRTKDAPRAPVHE